MASSVFWKFKSQKDESRVTFDGTTISVFDLKKEIILASNLLSSASDFDLQILDPATEQEYKDDNHQIARSTSVLAKRLPATRPGKGKAASYVVGIQAGAASRSESNTANAGTNTWQPGAPMSKRFDGREEPALKRPDDTPQFRSEGTSAEEAASIAAMFQASQEVWDETQEKMAQATPVYSNRGGFRGGKPFNQGNRGPGEAGGTGGGFQRPESRPVPPGYICYRCGKKGHWIHDCPTNDDRDWDNRPRVKRTTGIPRSFLKTVEQPNDGPLGQGVMVTPDGGFVVAQPDSVAWQKQRARPKALTSAEIYAAPAPAAHSDLACPICERLAKNAVRTPCCRTTYCEECIQNHLLDHDFVCRCGKKIASFDRLEVDEKRREQVGEVVRSMIEESRKESTKQDTEDTLPQSSSTNTIASVTSIATDTSTPPPNSTSTSTPTPTQDTSQQDLASLQAQFAQLSQMLKNTGLPPAARQQAQRQAQKINAEMQKIMMGGMGMGMGMNGGGAGGSGGGTGPGMGMGMGMGMGGPMNGGMGGGNQGGPMGMGGGMGGGMGMGMGNMGNGMGMGGGMMGHGMGMGNMGMPGMNMGGMQGMNGMGMGMGMMGNGMGGMGMNPMMHNNHNRMMGMNMGMGGPGPMNMGGPGPNMMGHNNPMMGGAGGGPMMGGGGQNWTNPFSNQQPAGNDSAYQRLPVHNRRKKRDRPSDFVEVGGDQSKVPRYWE
ncbi:hypothetical protein FRC12_001979 [Ceratobasidium sp. 428]|nr:hypothetical protein FRC12_001979 [Ceratobasidium sp. 428]